MTQITSISETLALAIESAQAGNTILARMHLQEVLAQDPTNLDAWLWLAWCAESPDSAVRSLEHLLTIDPDHELAWKGLIWASEMAEFQLRRSEGNTAAAAQRKRRETRARAAGAAAGWQARPAQRRDRATADDRRGTHTGDADARGYDPEPSDSVLEEDQALQTLDEAAATADTLIMPAHLATSTPAAGVQPECGGERGEEPAGRDPAAATTSQAPQDESESGTDRVPQGEADTPPTAQETDPAVLSPRGEDTAASDSGLSDQTKVETPRAGAGDAGVSEARTWPALQDTDAEEWRLPESFTVESGAEEPQAAPTEGEVAEASAAVGEADDASDVLAGPPAELRTPESMLATEDAAERLIVADLQGDQGRQAEFSSDVVPLDETGEPVGEADESAAGERDASGAVWQQTTTRELPTWNPDPYGEAEQFAAEEKQADGGDATASDPESAMAIADNSQEAIVDEGIHRATHAAETDASETDIDVAVTTSPGEGGAQDTPTGVAVARADSPEAADVDVTVQRQEADAAAVSESVSDVVGAPHVDAARPQPEAVPAEGVAEMAVAPEQAETADASAAGAASEERSDSGPVVLVVDDSATVRKLVSMTLEKHGYRVVTAFDGVAAIKEIAAHNPALILMDINMPRLDGYQLCKLVKKHPATSHIPVLMLSGKDGMFDKLRGKLVGASGYITKPFSPEGLVEVVGRELAAAAR